MPEQYRVAVKAPEVFGDDEPVLFSRIAHSSQQAQSLVMEHLYNSMPILGIMRGEVSVNVKPLRKVGGYDSPDIAEGMRVKAR